MKEKVSSCAQSFFVEKSGVFRVPKLKIKGFTKMASGDETSIPKRNYSANSVKPGKRPRRETKQSTKREDYLEWSDYFMGIAFLSGKRSKDPMTQVGACIVNEEMRIVGTGYNGMPNGCSDNLMPWSREEENILDRKQLYVCHAELNAVMNKNSADLKNCTIYVSLFPCNECAKVIIQSGIKEVVYYSDKHGDKPKYQASKTMFDMAGIIYSRYLPAKEQIEIDFTAIDAMSKGVIADMDSR